MPTKLIIIRGNSGSGKTTVAKTVRSKLGDGLSDTTMLVQQDVLRRDMLRERDVLEKQSIIKLIKLVVEFGRTQGRIVILEGIFTKKKYGDMLRELIEDFDEAHVYYFDLLLEETLRRHASKPNAHEFGEKEMREWWNDKDYLGLPNEKILTKDMSTDYIVNMVVGDIGIAKHIH